MVSDRIKRLSRKCASLVWMGPIQSILLGRKKLKNLSLTLGKKRPAEERYDYKVNCDRRDTPDKKSVLNVSQGQEIGVILASRGVCPGHKSPRL